MCGGEVKFPFHQTSIVYRKGAPKRNAPATPRIKSSSSIRQGDCTAFGIALIQLKNSVLFLHAVLKERVYSELEKASGNFQMS
jgi:hypothetical protein